MADSRCSNWKSQANERLPPVCPDDRGQIYWSYDTDSFSWRPRPLNYNIPTKPETWADYRDYALEELHVVHPLLTSRGGLSDLDVSEIENATIYGYPDLRSDTHTSQVKLLEFYKALAARNMLPNRPVY